MIELLIAMVLGLLVVGSALAIFLSNRQTYLATESLGRTQENARVAFELMSRDMRGAGNTPCGNNYVTVASVLNTTGNVENDPFWYDWNPAIRGYTDTEQFPDGTPANRVAGQPAVEVHYANGIGSVSVVAHNATLLGGTFTLSSADNGFNIGDIVVACDYLRATVFQITGITAPGNIIQYAQNNTLVPGNSTALLGGCIEQIGCQPTLYTFGANTILTRLGASRWYVGTNGRHNPDPGDPPCNDARNCSLYLQTVQNGAGTAPEEIAEGVQNLQVNYLLNENDAYYINRLVDPADDYVPANEVGVEGGPWQLVLGTRLSMDFVGQVGRENLPRTLSHTITMRNQIP